MIKVPNDLATARKLSEPPHPTLDTAIYHCQCSEREEEGAEDSGDTSVP